MAELADALDSGSSGSNLVGVQVPSSAPSSPFSPLNAYIDLVINMDQSVVNRKAKFDYLILERFEAGISLLGAEVKSIREGKANLRDSYVRILNGEAYLLNCHISPYSKVQGYQEIDPMRTRKLLLHRIEIDKLMGKSQTKGYAIIALAMYFKKGRVKVEIALAQGKKHADKREDIKRRIHDKESQAAIKKFTRKG